MPDSDQSLQLDRRLKVMLELSRQRLKEYVSFDASFLRRLIAMGALLAGWFLRRSGRPGKALRLEVSLHRRAMGPSIDKAIERRIGVVISRDRSLLSDYLADLGPTGSTEVFFRDPGRLLGSRILVLKSPAGAEKGLVSLDYSFVFPLFARCFDVPAIARRYHILLEPSWSGYCDLDILCFAVYDFPVFVQAYEPRDRAFISRLGSNLIPVDTAANWWVDHRVFRPLPGVTKDADVIMVASWARFKRHARLLAALRHLRERGERLQTILIGYANDWSRGGIYDAARYYGVADQVEVYERITPEEVNRHYNRARVNVVWSRREGVNRAIVEGFFAGVPGVVRLGFNYGYRYPYINERTGCFASEADLAGKLLELTRGPVELSPREWVLANMSPQIATRIVDRTIGSWCRSAKEPWEEGKVAVKLSQLDSQRYWDHSEGSRFGADYAFLHSTIRNTG
ncbi:glycosyltransferase [Thiococcus pfennigii]|uniref:glycosyltransferase n=1 Tax=Thiococcus pfennigii TaxID=1057 RepID=UPI0019071FC8|nr:glycosyltransferase [Thiococcus pfennigii]